MKPPDEGQLDSALVAALVAECGAELQRFLLGVLRDPQLAQDVMQTAIARMVERGHTAREETRKAWLFRVAFNEAMAVRRRQSTGRDVLQRVAWQLPAWHPAADQAALREEDVLRVRQALEELPEEQRQVVCMRIYEEKTFAQIAEALQIPLGTALSRMRMAVDKLRNRLNEA